MKEFIEKLIGRLEEQARWTENKFWCKDMGTTLKIVPFRKVEEIVNQLAEEHNNDFCEWFKYDYRTIAPKNHDAENPYWRIPDNMDKLKFCPYCGKKIKVVE